MKRYVVLDKQVGQTPLMALQAWKSQHPSYADVPASYAGRLDPMASGKLLILLGEECKQQRMYTNLDKEYEIEVVLDFGSDTGDVLGIATFTNEVTQTDAPTLKQVLRKECGAQVRAYPAFSSKTVNGKPLFLHTLEGTLEEKDIPQHIERVYGIRLQSVQILSRDELKKKIFAQLSMVPRTSEPSKRRGNDFRVAEVTAKWQTLFASVPERSFAVLRLCVTCASGTYMRSLAGRIGTSLGTKALALSIARTKVGKFASLWGAVGFWVRTY